jgi:stage V sporulation protein B
MFERFGGDRSAALSEFGMIRGMVIPILFFPFAFLSSMVSVLIPEISRLNVKEDKTERNAKITKIMSLSFIFSTVIGGMFFFFAREIGETFYRGENTFEAIRILALVTPFMYIETISDGLLKGIGEQMTVLGVNISNSVFRILIILFLIPLSGATGYLWLLVASNTYAFAMCIRKLKKVTNFEFDFIKNALAPFLIVIFSGLAGQYLLRVMQITINWLAAGVGTLIFMGIFGALYFLPQFRRKEKL